MNIDKNAKIKEIFGLALKSEIEAANFYSSLLKKVNNNLLIKKIEFLVFEEKKHRQLLERLFSQKFPHQKVTLPKKSFFRDFPLERDEKLTILKLFKIALQAEKSAQDFYLQAGKRAVKENNQNLFKYLARVEKSHYFMIKSEIELLEIFPEYYNVKGFHWAQDMIHIGP